jgi:hypothetical protein
LGGCGRFFEGDATQMNHALNEVLASLDDETVSGVFDRVLHQLCNLLLKIRVFELFVFLTIVVSHIEQTLCGISKF